MNITLVKSRPDGLYNQHFGFYLQANFLVLQSYYVEAKETKRHKFRIHSRYDRISHQKSELKEFEVPLTDTIRKEALAMLMSEIVVATTSEMELTRKRSPRTGKIITATKKKGLAGVYNRVAGKDHYFFDLTDRVLEVHERKDGIVSFRNLGGGALFFKDNQFDFSE